MHTYILRSNLGKRYKLYTNRRGPCASSTVRENLKPLTFNDPVYAKQFIRFLDAPVNLWQKLAHQHTTFIRNTDIATQISHLLITGKLRFYELPDTTANTAPLQTQPVQGEGYTTYQFAPTTQLLINDTQPVKEFAQFETLVRFIDELDIEEKTLQEMNKQLGLYDPLNNHYEASVKYLAEAIYAGKIIVFANDNKIQRQPAELDTYTPTQKPRTLGPEIPAASIVAPPVEDRKKIDTEQAQALIQASELGTAFCAECEEAKQAEAEASQSPQSQPLQSQAPQPMAASPIEERKGIQPHSLDDAAARLESVSQAIEQEDPKSAFDVDKAVTELNANAHNKSTGYCALYVRKALEAGGMEILLSERPAAAKNYGELLMAKGLSVIDKKGYVPNKGDIVVLQPYKAQSSQAGHIQMYNGSQWISDFKQRYDNPNNRVNNLYPGPSYRREKVEYEIYRP